MSKIGIIGAMELEVEELKSKMTVANIVKKAGMEHRFEIASVGVSSEESGNPVYPPARRELATRGVRCDDHRARQLQPSDYDDWDYLIGMDMSNITRMLRILGGDPEDKVFRLMDFTGKPADVADPWYSDRFDICYNDVLKGCEALLAFLEARSSEE